MQPTPTHASPLPRLCPSNRASALTGARALRSCAGVMASVLLTSTLIVATPRALAQDTTTESTGAAPTPTPAGTEKPQIHTTIAAADPDVQAFNEHLIILASPWMEGRLPGTKGMERAMDYMEDQFRKAGLEPAFQPSDGSAKSYRQPFSLGGKREVVEETITVKCGADEKSLAVGKDFKLTSLGRSGTAEGAIAFVGYGIEDGPDGYNSFAEGHSLEGKIALLLRFEPMDANGKSRWSNGDGWSGRAGFAGKIAAVAKRKPAAILVVNTPGADDPRIDSLTAGGGRAMADVPVFMVSTAAGEDLVARCGGTRTLLDLRKLADEPKAGEPASFDLADSKIAVAGRTEERPVKAENVVATLPGRGKLAKEVIVIGGHLDHLGMGDFGSREGPGKLHPGADDNASGAAGIILLGESLKKAYDAAPADASLRTIVFAGFSAEESGLIGSRFYVDNPIYPIADTVLMMNFDMIGRIKNGRVAVTSSGNAKGMTEWAKPFFDASGMTVVHTASRGGGGGGGSDHASFQAVGVPILFAICADFHEDYHTSRDTYDQIDREMSVKAVHLWHELCWDMAKREARFEMDEAARGPMRAQPMKVRAGMRTRETDDQSGLDVVDVTKDGSADKAGIKKGDKIIKWNKKEMKDRQAFVDDLRSHDPGAKVQAVVLRDGQEITIYVELQAAQAAP